MKTSQKQFELMVTYMEEHGDLSKPTSNARGRMVANQNWDELTSLLNSDGSGDTKTIEEWKKVWSVLKNNTEKKAARLHRAAQGTGGGPAVCGKLSGLELRVLKSIGTQVATGLAIAEAGFPQENVTVKNIEQMQLEVQHEVDSNKLTSLEKSGSSTQNPSLPGPSSQYHISNLQLSEIHLEQRSSLTEPRPTNEARIESPRPTSRTMDMPTSRPIVSPPDIVIHEEPIENIHILPCSTPAQSPGHIVAASVPRPALYGQTPLCTSRFSRIRPMQGYQPSHRRVRLQRNHTELAAQHFLHSRAEWRALRIEQHNGYMELKREQSRIRDLEVQTQAGQREWLALGLRVIDLLDKLFNKFCKD